MAQGLAPQLPLAIDKTDGYQLIKDYYTLAAQNLRNLLLCHPGERSMNHRFGAGLRRFLFEGYEDSTYDRISSEIHKQVEEFMNYIKIEEIIFYPSPEDVDTNILSLSIRYQVTPLGTTVEELRLSLEGLDKLSGVKRDRLGQNLGDSDLARNARLADNGGTFTPGGHRNRYTTDANES